LDDKSFFLLDGWRANTKDGREVDLVVGIENMSEDSDLLPDH
jgi:hypothetical protein